MTADLLAYRLKVATLMLKNKDKYPVFNEYLDMTNRDGSIIITVISIAMVMDKSFELNKPIAECARIIEELTAKGKADAEAIVTEWLKESTVSDTKH